LIQSPRFAVPGVEEPGEPVRRSWPAQLNLDYMFNGDKTLVRRRHVGPLMTQRPFYPERDGTCHSYILHPPGGVAGGDLLDLRITVARDARCVLTAPGATKVYRAPRETSRHRITIEIAENGVCEFLPMETILFNQANADFETVVDIRGGGIFFGWDVVSLGRPAANERFEEGSFRQSTMIRRNGTPVWFERARIDGGDGLRDAAFGFNGAPIFGTAIYAGPLPEETVDILRDRVPATKDGLGAFTQMDDLLVCRFLGGKVSSCRGFFADAWKVLRVMGQGKPANIPRIWAT